MAYRDLREFIDELERRHLLKRIKVPVDADLEITEITDRVSNATSRCCLKMFAATICPC